jgi:hypothetical protein
LASRIEASHKCLQCQLPALFDVSLNGGL